MSSRGPEGKEQTKIRSYLRKEGWLVNKISLCSVTGWPDLLCVKNGKVILIEVKAPGKKPTYLQEYTHQLIREYGLLVFVFDSFTAFKKEYNLITRNWIKQYAGNDTSIFSIRIPEAKGKSQTPDLT